MQPREAWKFGMLKHARTYTHTRATNAMIKQPHYESQWETNDVNIKNPNYIMNIDELNIENFKV